MSRTKHHGDKAKKRLFGKYWQWVKETPSWWISMHMTKPQRKAVKTWERNAGKTDDIEELDTPPHGNKPHKYYW